MYVCMYVYMYIYIYVCMYVCVTFYRKRSMCFLQLNFIGLQWRMFTTDVHNSGNDWWTVGWGSNIKLSLLSVHQLKSVNITILEYMYVCMYVCIYVYIYICMYVCMCDLLQEEVYVFFTVEFHRSPMKNVYYRRTQQR